MLRSNSGPLFAAISAALVLQLAALAQPFDSALFRELRWRMIGPHRGGRTVAAVGVPGHPTVFYIGVNHGGVWRSNDYGRVWTPIFDDQPTGSIGAIAVAPSDPRILYVGTGEGLQRPDLSTGDGVYRSSDGGKTWRNVGLKDSQQIAALAVDPRDPEHVYAASLGHPYGPNAERGVYATKDGGASWRKLLGPGPDVGAFEVLLDPSNPDRVYAVLWAGRQAPWEIGSSFQIEGAGLYRSTDGGEHWQQLHGGLPESGEDPLGRIGIAIAPSLTSRLYAIVDIPKSGGLYRSDDGGDHWKLACSDSRLWARGSDFAEVRVDPKDPDTVYVANIAAWKSTDGGRTFTGFRGAPGGDDYHRLWIQPDDPKTMLLAGDQGAIVSVNGGETWSSWYNQPTAQFYHVTTDSAFPYRVYGGQQESGSVGISSRGDHGQITFREWQPVGIEEYGYIAVDPLDSDVIYGGKLHRFDRRTGQVQNVAPLPLRKPGSRLVRTQPVVFSPVDPRCLFFASNVLWKTTSGGREWEQISPDLTRESYAIPANLGAFAARDPEQGRHRGVLYTVAPSPLEAGRIWVGTDDGLIHLTQDGGKSWTNVTPEQLVPWAKVSLIEASHFDRDTAYAAINTFRLDDLRPHILRTRDRGRTWSQVTNGIPDGGIVNVVREDPRRKDLLYAGTERAVYVSFDAGEHWQSLRQNMPATSIRDLVVKDDDLVVATHGRSFWILDDVTPLRQLTPDVATAEAFLFAPQVAIRVRWNMNPDTPLPQEEPAGANPPDGAVIDYWLAKAAPGPVTLEIEDGNGKLVRRYTSDAVEPAPLPGRNIPDYWLRKPVRLASGAGMHRFTWDLRHELPKGLEQSYPIAAIFANTPLAPLGPWVLPGEYRVRLGIGGKSFGQALTVKLDPRVTTTPQDLAANHELSLRLAAAVEAAHGSLEALNRLRAALAQPREDKASAATAALAAKATGFATGQEGLVRTLADLATLYDILQAADLAPTSQCRAAATETLSALDRTLGQLRELVANDLARVNAERRAGDLPALEWK